MLQRPGSDSYVVTHDGRSLRVSPRLDGAALVLSVMAGAPPADAELVACTLAAIEQQHGAIDVITTALHDVDRGPFEANGFREIDALHLLARPLQPVPGAPALATGPPLRRPHRRDWPLVEALDALAFAPLWRLERAGIEDAVRATATARLRVVGDARPLGYVVVGRSAKRGYVQRLAVHPDAAGRGLGSALLLDGLRWLRRRGAADALVNTQHTTERALALYERHGFVRQRHGLVVLGRRLGPS